MLQVLLIVLIKVVAEDLQVPISEMYESTGKWAFGAHSQIFNSREGQSGVQNVDDLKSVIKNKHIEDYTKGKTVEKMRKGSEPSNSQPYDIIEEMKKVRPFN